MSSPLDALTADALARAEAHTARFDAPAFTDLAASRGAALWHTTRDPTLLRSYLSLLAEVVAMGCARTTAGSHDSLLSLLIVDLAPARLAALPQPHRPHALAEAWNLGEGLLREPRWMNRYAAARCVSLTDLGALRAQLAAVLDPVLAPRPPARWSGPLSATTLDPRPAHDGFLPGAMHLAAPAVVCVHDRRREGDHLGVFLERGGESHLLGATPCLGDNLSEGSSPPVSLDGDTLSVGPLSARVPFLRSPHERLATSTGFVLLSAVDSQRLWVLDSP